MLSNILSETELSAFKHMTEKARHVLLTCHVSPDGDALGAMLSCLQFLQRKGKKVTAVTPNIFPDFLKWLPCSEEVMIFEKQPEEVKSALSDVDLVMCLDFNDLKRLDIFSETVKGLQAPKIMLDHHPNPSNEFELAISYPEMCATCELLFRLFIQTDSLDNISEQEATCLYTGMMTDTGCFSYNSNRSEIYMSIAALLSKGIDKDKIYRQIYYNYPVGRFQLMGYLLYVKMKAFSKFRTALMTLTYEEQKRFAFKKGDTEGFVNIPLQIKGNKLSIFLRENPENGTIRVSLRSVDDFPCNKMAEEFFNGGGHLNAAGGVLECDMEKAERVVDEALKKYAPLLSNE